MSISAKIPVLDRLDRAIVAALQADGRIAMSALGRRLGLSQPAMSERVRRLEESGVIAGYTARIDPRALGLTTSAIIRLRTSHAHISACLEQFASMPEVIDVDRVTGEDCFFVRVLVPAPESLERIVDSLARFGTVTTNVVLRTEKPKPIDPALASTPSRTAARRRRSRG